MRGVRRHTATHMHTHVQECGGGLDSDSRSVCDRLCRGFFETVVQLEGRGERVDRLVLLRITTAGFLVFVLGTTKVMTERGFPGSWLYIKMHKKCCQTLAASCP